MQSRRYRPGDVLDDYCPRERRITDHAIVAMVDEEIQRTRCSVCDTEHEYKEAKVPAPRRKTQPPALFTQVLDNLQGGATRPHSPSPAPPADDTLVDAPVAAATVDDPSPPPVDEPSNAAAPDEPLAAEAVVGENKEEQPAEDDREREGGFRRSLIRATFPRPEGQTPAPRNVPEFTVQSLHNRRNNSGKFRGRRRQGGGTDNVGPMRFRDHGQGDGRPNGQGGGRRRRGGKKNR